MLENDTLIQINTTGSYSVLTLIGNEYGLYKCRFSNHFGTVEKIFKVDVPPITTFLTENMFFIIVVGILGTGILSITAILCVQVFCTRFSQTFSIF